MKKVIFLIAVACFTRLSAQVTIPDGRYLCTSPIWAGADSLAFEFLNGTYKWYINSNLVSAGSFSFIDGLSGPDTLSLTENPPAGCLNNGGQNPIKFSYLYSPPPGSFFPLSETQNSMSNCTVHSSHFPGDYYFQTALSSVEQMNTNNRITITPTLSGLNVSIPHYTGFVSAEIYTMDGKLIHKQENMLTNNLISIPLAPSESPQHLMAKIILNDGTIKVSRFLR